ncbi:MAG TPA: hypothetical protein DFH97_04455 [Clostridiales bacterium]|nr:hypothetical protein [Clostridiales bacterium]HBK03858.1 hypothetical protein [Clostridiales bacterium]HCI64271.1 hypothetical protein [Clostridiales bacterium]
MREFWIRLGSMEDVEEFVSIATSRAFPISVRDDQHKIRGGSFMEMFCLDFNQPLRVVVQCSEEELGALRRDAERFLVK